MLGEGEINVPQELQCASGASGHQSGCGVNLGSPRRPRRPRAVALPAGALQCASGASGASGASWCGVNLMTSESHFLSVFPSLSFFLFSRFPFSVCVSALKLPSVSVSSGSLSSRKSQTWKQDLSKKLYLWYPRNFE